MDLQIYNPNFQLLYMLESFESLLWTERYDACGEFELYTPVNSGLLSYLVEDNLLLTNISPTWMIIETVSIETLPEKNDVRFVHGRALESILERRIVWNYTVIDGSLQDGIELLLNQNFIAPTNPDRVYDNFIFNPSSDPAITGLTLQNQFCGEDILSLIETISQAYGIGFRIRVSSSKELVFELYAGTDRSHDQFINPYVIFSNNFENIIRAQYKRDKRKEKTTALVVGPGEVDSRLEMEVSIDDPPKTGFDRREIFVNSDDLQTTYDGVPLTQTELEDHLTQRGNDILQERYHSEIFESEVDVSRSFKYRADFFLGDILQMEDDYGHSDRVRLIEMIHSQDPSGIKTNPTFSTIF